MGIQSHLFFFTSITVFLVLIHFLTDLLFLRLYVIVRWNFKNINLNMVQEGCHFSVSCCVKY